LNTRELGGPSGPSGSGSGGLSAAEAAVLDDRGSVVLPVVAEEAMVSRREVETGRVRVHLKPVTEDRLARLTTGRTVVDVERVAVGRVVDTYPEERIEGDVRVIPVVEERLVVEKRLFLVEEIRVRRRRIEEEHDVPVTLRRHEVVVERLPAMPAGDSGPGLPATSVKE
jgi:uncharacterized protein (TIGR02271 family)